MVWSLFSKGVNSTAECKLCQNGFAFIPGRSANLMRHLRLKHRKNIEELGWKKRGFVSRKNVPSEVWTYFTKIGDGTREAECCLCKAHISIYHQSTNSMIRHLQTKHPEECEGKSWKPLRPILRNRSRKKKYTQESSGKFDESEKLATSCRETPTYSS